MARDGRITFLRIAIGIFAVAFLVSAGFKIYYFIYRPMTTKISDVPPLPGDVPVRSTPPAAPEGANVPETLSIETNYTGYFDEGDKCRRTYDETFGDKTGATSGDSACGLTVVFSRDGTAEKTIALRKFVPESGVWRDAETRRWTAGVTRGEFESLAAAVTGNEAFRSWPDGGMVTARNAMVTAKYADGRVRSPMSNVNEKTVVFLELIEAFRRLDKRTAWVASK
jgi:hypothetical protein